MLWCLDADSNRVRPDPCDHDFDVVTNADDLFNAARKYEHVDLLVFVVRTGPASPSWLARISRRDSSHEEAGPECSLPNVGFDSTSRDYASNHSAGNGE